MKSISDFDVSRNHQTPNDSYFDTDAEAGLINNTNIADTSTTLYEYWHPNCPPPPPSQNLASRWLQITEESRLKIITSRSSTDGTTLYLRFLSDLQLIEEKGHGMKPRSVKSMYEKITKNDSLLWCQTVVRLCGPSQLYLQRLPHFGDLGNDELRDYLEVITSDRTMGEGRKDSDGAVVTSVRKQFKRLIPIISTY